MTRGKQDILMREYDLVNIHWTLATRQKAVIVQICGTLLTALLGAAFLDHLTWANFSLLALAIVIVAALIYAQKEGDYWAAAICLESIERVINETEGFKLLSYVQDFKEILFRRSSRVSRSPFRILHLVRITIGCLLVVVACGVIYDEYGLFLTSLYALGAIGSLLYLALASQYTTSTAQRKLEERLDAVRRAHGGKCDPIPD